MQFLFKAVALLCKVVCRLRVLRQAGALCLCFQLFQRRFALSFQTLFARQNVHGKLFVVRKVRFVQLIEHHDVLHQLHLVALKGRRDLIHVHFGLVVTCLHAIEAVCLLFKEAEEALFFFARIKAFQLYNKVRDLIAYFAEVLRAHICKRRVGEVCNFLLCAGAILHHERRACNVNFFRKVVYDLLFFGRKLHFGLFLFFFLRGYGLFFLHAVQRQGRNAGCGGLQLGL